MKARQLYQTTVFGKNFQEGFTYLTIPKRSMRKNAELKGTQYGRVPVELFRDLGIRELDTGVIREIDNVSIEWALIHRVFMRNSVLLAGTGKSPQRKLRNIDKAAHELLHTNFIPFEGSPLAAYSLAEIIKTTRGASPTAIGAGIGIAVVAGGASPLLFLFVPAGIIVCGMSSSLTKWLDQNRQLIFSKLFGVKTPRKSSKRSKKKVKRMSEKSLLEAIEPHLRKSRSLGYLGPSAKERFGNIKWDSTTVAPARTPHKLRKH